MVRFRYSRWDGTQEPFRPDAERAMDAISEGLFDHGDLARALRELFSRGLEGPDGQRRAGLRDLADRLQGARRERLQRHDMDSVMEGIRERLDEVVGLEQAGIQRSVADADQRLRDAPSGEAEALQGLMDFVQQRARSAEETLESLPESPAGKIRELSEHDFIDSDAREKFNELLNELRQQMLQNFARRTSEALKEITPEQQAALRDMLRALNQMLRDRAEGRAPDFDGFMERFGHFFDPDRPGSLDELLDMLQDQMAQLGSLLGSMSPDAREDLMQAVREALDPGTLAEMAELAAMMEEVRPGSTASPAYPFAGDESLTLGEAMSLMEELQDLDNLEASLRDAARTGDLDAVDPEEAARLLGEDARDTLDELERVAKLLEEEGYLRRAGDRWELTPRAIRTLGERALREVFSNLGKDRFGGHPLPTAGAGGEPTGATRPFEPGEPFQVNLHRSLYNAVARRGAGVPVRMEVRDFEVDELEHTTDAATVLLLDQSSSMRHYGRWGAAKKVAMALQALIQGKFPRDRLFVVGFSDYAAELKAADLPAAEPNDWVQGTNMQHALMLARRLLGRERAATRQVIMITDGEPTAHLVDGRSYFSYPPTREAVAETLKEVRRCTQAGITINTFMLEEARYLAAFIDYVTKVNKGRAFFTSPGRLGDYILVDYVNNRRRRVA